MTTLSDPKAELQAILSVCSSKHPDVPYKLMGLLTKYEFAYPVCREIFKRLKKLIVEGKNIPSLKVLKHDASLSDEARAILDKPTVKPVNRLEDVDHLHESLLKYRRLRLLYGHSKEVLHGLRGKDVDVDQMVLSTEDTLFKLKNESNSEIIDHAGEGGNSDELTKDILENDQSGEAIPLGFKNFDEPSGSLRKGQYLIIASHYKGGKSMFALNMCVNQYKSHKLSTVLIPLEMSRREVRQRLLSRISKVPFNKIYRGAGSLSKDEKKQIWKAWKKFDEHGQKHGCRFTVWKPRDRTIDNLIFKLKPMEYDVVCVDYVNLLRSAKSEGGFKKPDGSNDWQDLSAFHKSLKDAADQMKCLMVGLTQMNSDGSIRYSKAALEDCDCALTWFYQEEQMATHLIEVQVAVARNFPTFQFVLKEDFSVIRVKDYDGPMPDSDISGDDIPGTV